MNTIEFIKLTIKEVFKDEDISVDALTSYTTNSSTLFSICEESEDLAILENSYE